MSNKRSDLTPEELEESKRLLEAWKLYCLEHPGATQLWLAREALGASTQGAAWGYLHGHTRMNISALSGFSRALKVPPEKISPRLAARLPTNVDLGQTLSPKRGLIKREFLHQNVQIPWVSRGQILESLRMRSDEIESAEEPLHLPREIASVGPFAKVIRVWDDRLQPFLKRDTGWVVIEPPEQGEIPPSGEIVLAQVGDGEPELRFFEEIGGGQFRLVNTVPGSLEWKSTTHSIKLLAKVILSGHQSKPWSRKS